MNIKEFVIDKKLKDLTTNKIHRKILKEVIFDSIDNDKHIDYVINSYNDFIRFKNLMKNEKIIIEEFFEDKNKNNTKSFENFNDNVQKTIIKNKAKKLKRSIISNKYKSLCNDKTQLLFLDMAQMDFTHDELQKFIGKKIAAFSDPLELNAALENIIEFKDNWSEEGTLKKIKKNNLENGIDYEIEYSDNNQQLIHLKTFKATNALGSKMWCISREERMFDSYKNSSYNDYKILFDYNKEPSEDLSMVAILTDIQNIPNEIYSKSDKELGIANYKPFSELLQQLNNDSFIKSLKKAKSTSHLYRKYRFLDKKINPEDTLFLENVFYGFKNLNFNISQKDIDENPELFENVTIESDVNIFTNSKIQKHFKNFIDDGIQMHNVVKNWDTEIFIPKLFKETNVFDKYEESLNFEDFLIGIIERKDFESTADLIQLMGDKQISIPNVFNTLFGNNEALEELHNKNALDKVIKGQFKIGSEENYIEKQKMLINNHSYNKMKNIEKYYPEITKTKRDPSYLNHLRNNEFNAFITRPDIFNKYYDKNMFTDIKHSYIENAHSLLINVGYRQSTNQNFKSRKDKNINIKEKFEHLSSWSDINSFSWDNVDDKDKLTEELQHIDLFKIKDYEKFDEVLFVLDKIFDAKKETLDLSVFLDAALSYYEPYSSSMEGFPKLDDKNIEILNNFLELTDKYKGTMKIEAEELGREFGDDHTIVQALLERKKLKKEQKNKI